MSQWSIIFLRNPNLLLLENIGEDAPAFDTADCYLPNDFRDLFVTEESSGLTYANTILTPG